MEWIEFTYPYLPIFRLCNTTECIVPGMYAMVSFETFLVRITAHARLVPRRRLPV